MKTFLCATSAIGALFALSMPAFAQTALQPADTDSTIEEVVVTARKKEESLQDVPVAVSAFSEKQLEQAGVKSPADLQKMSPSVQIVQAQRSSDNVIFNIRGQVAGDLSLTTEQAVSTYFDGFNAPHPYGTALGLFDLERVEVLKGPQGTLYGRNTTGGAVNIISKGADHNGLHGFAFAEAGNYKNVRVNGAVNIPIVQDKLALRLAGQYWNRNGYGKSAVTGQDLGDDKNQVFVRGTLLANPSERLQIEVKGEWARARENGYLGTPVSYAGTQPNFSLLPAGQQGTIFAANQTVAIELGLNPALAADRTTAANAIAAYAALGLANPFVTYQGLLSHNNVDRKKISATIDLDVTDTIQIKNIIGYSSVHSDPIGDYDGVPFRMLQVGVRPNGTTDGPFTLPNFDLNQDNFFSEEFNLSGQAFNERLNWAIGAFYGKETGKDTTTNDALYARGRTLGNPFTFNINEIDDVLNSSWSVFTQNDVKVSETVSATLGWRYTEETHGLTWLNRRFNPQTNLYQCTFLNTAGVLGPTTPATQTTPGTGRITATPSDCAASRKRTFVGNSWLASLNWKVAPQTLVYLKTSRGFRGGGFNNRLAFAPSYEPEYARDVELGLKSDFLDGRLRTNFALYRTAYSNKQETIIVTIPGITTPTTLTQNAGSATIKGVEGEITAKPFQGFTLRGSFSYLDGVYKSFVGAIDLYGRPVNASGEKFANPPWQYNISGRYEHELGAGKLGAQADWSWQAGARPSARVSDISIPTSVSSRLVSGQAGFNVGTASLGLLNLRLDYDLPEQGLNFAAFMTNALDKTVLYYGLNGLSVAGPQNAIVGAPRMFGFQVKKRFGDE